MVYEMCNYGEFDREIEYYTCVDKIIKRISLVMADLEKGKFIVPSDKCKNDFALFKDYLMNVKNQDYEFMYEYAEYEYADKKENGTWISKVVVVKENCADDEDRFEKLVGAGEFMEIPDVYKEFMAFTGVEFPYCFVIEKDGEQDG